MKNFILLIALVVLFINSASADFGNTTTKKIDKIENNTGTNIILSPVANVEINTLTGEFALQSSVGKEITESATTNVELGYVSGVTSSIQTQLNGKESTLPNTTDGDLLYYNSGQSALAIGTLGQLLTVDGSGFPSWMDAPTASPLTTKGDIYTFDTDVQRLGVGAEDQILSVDSAEATGLKWIDPPSTSPTTTEGDTIVRGASEDERLAIGTADQVLTSNGTTAAWQDATSGGSPSFNTVTKTTTATLLITGEDNVVLDATSGDFTVTLPTAIGNNGVTYKLSKSTTANKITLDAFGAELIGDELTVILATKGDDLIIFSDGTNWKYASDGISYFARMSDTSGQTSNNTRSALSFNTVEDDTHNGFSVNTYTIPIDGEWSIGGDFGAGSAAWLAGHQLYVSIVINGTEVATSRLTIQSNTTQGMGVPPVYTTIRLSKNDTVQIHSQSSLSNSTSSSVRFTWFSIVREKQ